ncbi:hypothetical protein L798_10412 [Zootermopsis nevadensis]|uniref:Uncharacterized protein n=1 Tax=Zootermopsis nevadensis TaxID=136037 RepID=A0A067R7Q7_ZOONE|nr:hypothetical protein L798_10412 [Zootermopsis nevadensis]
MCEQKLIQVIYNFRWSTIIGRLNLIRENAPLLSSTKYLVWTCGVSPPFDKVDGFIGCLCCVLL